MIFSKMYRHKETWELKKNISILELKNYEEDTLYTETIRELIKKDKMTDKQKETIKNTKIVTFFNGEYIILGMNDFLIKVTPSI